MDIKYTFAYNMYIVGKPRNIFMLLYINRFPPSENVTNKSVTNMDRLSDNVLIEKVYICWKSMATICT